jgi:hypothetical protein|tara:strand:- start:220 stop:375 length:156 start_codon:yes stop_codon:yes gene_type:complete
MIKKLLSKIVSSFSYEHDKDKIEKYLSKSKDLIDLENRMKELEKKGAYNRF